MKIYTYRTQSDLTAWALNKAWGPGIDLRTRWKVFFLRPWSQASNGTSVAPSLLLSLGHNPRLGAQFLFGEHKQLLGGARPRNAPRGVGPAANLQQFIEL